MTRELPGLIITAIGFLVGLGILTIAERYFLEYFKFAEWPKSLTYPLLSNAVAGFVVILGFVLLFVLAFVGVIVAFDKGYESALPVLVIAVAAPFIGLALMIGVRAVNIRWFEMGSWGFAALYALGSTIVVLFCCVVVILFFLLVTQSLGIDKVS